MSDVNKDDRIILRIPTDEKERIEKAAKEDDRSLSQWVRLACKEKLERDHKGRK